MNDQPQTPPDPPPAPEAPQPPPAQHAPYVPPPLPPGYEQHYRPIYQGPPAPKPPSNDSAVASIILACGSLGVLFITGGLLSPLTLITSAIAIPLGHKGKSNVDNGNTTQGRDIAVAGFWTGIGGVALSLLALIAWIVIAIVAFNSDIHWTDSNGHMHHLEFQ